MKRFLTVFFLYSLTISGVTAADELVSFELVRQSFGSVEVRKPYAASMSVRTGDSLELVSDAGYNFGLSVTKTTYSPLGNRIIHASTDGGGKALIVADKAGGLLGSITEFGERHQISTTADGQRRIFKQGYSGREKRIDDGGVPPPRPDMPTARLFLDLKEEELSSLSSRVMKAERSSDVIYPAYKTGTAKISVLMYYDDSMSNVFSTIDFITQVANDAYADSGAKIEIDIVGTKALDIDDEASHYDLKSAMEEGEAPFADIESDRSFFEADLVYMLRDTEAPDGEDPCGVASLGAYKQRHFRAFFTGLVQWDPAEGAGTYCSDLSFAHEVGHSLGARHDRADYEDGKVGAYSFSYGTARAGVFRTVMGVSNTSSSPRLGLFSSPDLNCDGYPCGKPASSADSADNVSTFQSTGHLIASNEGPFAFEAVSAFAVDGQDTECEDNGESGWWKAHGIRNQYKETLNVAELHYVRENGSTRSYPYDKGERTLAPGTSRYYGWCDTESNAASTDFVEAFARYYHPDTDELVETSHAYFDEDYDGEYFVARVATSRGGKVIGHPEQYVRAGASKTFTFTPESGYEVANIQSNCSGRKSGNSYTVDVGQDNCFVEAAFSQVAVSETLRVSIETPANGQVYSGIGNFQGWAVAQEGIDRVDLYVDGVFFQSAPYGGARGDVGNVFPDVPSSNNSGFSLAYNYGNLFEGEHTLRAVAVTKDGRTLERSTAFSVTKFHKDFIGPQDAVSLNGASCEVQGSQMSVVDALIDGKSYDISLEWRTGTQGFEIYKIR
ncbi:M12 family metallo-peptidase [Luminiphilus sp.]|nr:M12 family metallo-peptidase [Luminiphilus sp.]